MMKEIALQVAKETGVRKLNVLREYLQNEILFLMQQTGFGSDLYFVGGTALRFLYKIKRYSEDLDFSAGEGWQRKDVGRYAVRLQNALVKAGYSLDAPVKDEKTVQRVFVRFKDVLFEAGLSDRREQNLSINIEIDANPPAGWVEEKTIINIHMPVLIRHYDKPSVFAAKCAAFLTRPYTKGRDAYDLFWLRSKWKDLRPNFELLNNALRQKIKKPEIVAENNWLEVMATKAAKLNWRTVEQDVAPFLEDLREAATLTKENFLLLYSK
jgi:predicted nucleotidyltransferase component of viral defense system